MELKPHYYENLHIHKLPYTSSSQNHRDNFYYKRNNSKKISEKENIRKIGDSSIKNRIINLIYVP